MRQIKNILINCFLLATFIVPQVIQYYHVLTIKHFVSHCDESCSNLGNHFHKATLHCPIHEFTFDSPDKLAEKTQIAEPQTYTILFETLYQQPQFQLSVYYYFLRAPPYSFV